MGNTPVECLAQRQPLVQTATYGAELYALKVAVEKAVALRYYLRSMGMPVTKLTVIYYNKKAVVTNTTIASSILTKKYLALAYELAYYTSV